MNKPYKIGWVFKRFSIQIFSMSAKFLFRTIIKMTKSSVRSKTEVLMLKIKPIILTARTAKNRRRVLDDQKEPSFLQSGSGLTWFLKKTFLFNFSALVL